MLMFVHVMKTCCYLFIFLCVCLCVSMTEPQGMSRDIDVTVFDGIQRSQPARVRWVVGERWQEGLGNEGQGESEKV